MASGFSRTRAMKRKLLQVIRTRARIRRCVRSGRVHGAPVVAASRADPGGPARRPDERVHDRRRSRRRSVVRSALGRRHAQREADSGGAAARPRRGDDCGRGSPVLVAPGRRPPCHAPGAETERRGAAGRRGRIHDHAADGQAAAQPADTARRRGLAAKVYEAVLALRLEHRLTKREVLALYSERRGIREPDRGRSAGQPPVFRPRRVDVDAGPGRLPGRTASASVWLQPVPQPRGGARAPEGRCFAGWRLPGR